MIIVTVDDDVSCLHIGGVERNDIVSSVLDKCIDIDDALAEFVSEEGVVVRADLRDCFDTAVLAVVHALSHVTLSCGEDVRACFVFSAFRRGKLRCIDVRAAEVYR